MKNIDRPVIACKIYPLLLLVLLFGFCLSSEGAEKKEPPATSVLEITTGALKTKIDAINARQGFDEALKSKVLKFYQSAQDNLANIESFKAQTLNFKLALKDAPEQIKKLQKEIDRSQPKVSKQSLEDFSRISTDELVQRQIIEKSKISNLEEQITKIENELATQNIRPQLIRQEMVKARQDIEDSQKKLSISSANADAAPETDARQTYLKTLIDARTAELKMLDVEAMSNPGRIELLKVQSELLNLQKNTLSPVTNQIEDLLTERRQQEAKEVQDSLSQAEKELSGKDPLIQSTTRENINYSKELQSITDKIEEYNEQKAKVDTRADEIDSDFKSAEKKITLAGLSPALGKILREQRRNLTAPDQFTLQTETIENETAFTSLEQFKVEDSLKQLNNVDDILKEIMASQVDQKLPVEQRMMIQAELRVLMNSQKELLNKLDVAYVTYLRVLGDFDFARQQMLANANKFAAYLDERLLWVPSSEPINANYLPGLYQSTKWLLSPYNWIKLAQDALRSVLNNLFLVLIAVSSLVSLQLVRGRAKQELTAIADKVERIYTDNFSYTLKAFGYTLILVLTLPLLVYYLGVFLRINIQAADFSKAVGAGLRSAAISLFFLQMLYRLFANNGIAHKHFQWKTSTVVLMRRQIAWLRFVAVACIFMISATGASTSSVHSDTVGRLALVISMSAMAVFFSRMLHPTKGVLQETIAANPDSWLARLRYLWYPAVMFIPLIIIGFAVAGYYLSALELQQQLIISLRLIFLMVIVHEMVFRWLMLVNRQLAIENARQQREAARLVEKHPQAIGGEDPVLPVDNQLIDIPKVNEQTLRLLSVFIGFSLIAGLWMIWKNILPAFSFLERIVLWQHLVTSSDNQEIYQPVTMTNLILAGLYIFLAVVSVRNFSGVMELLVFRRLSIEAGSRYAVNQMAKYILVSIGFIGVANELGGSWSQVQWLVAALSVGLGFGLQEIFANLVSGIILLFERPIRVGDTVTIGDVTGKVSRIQMRATTLIDWDQKEMIIPNKTFITSQLVNWTLTDAITRIVIPVGIAYGADAELAQKVMLDTVKSIPLILAEPAPSVLCVGFGDSALNFSIRIFVSELANRLPVTHDLHIRMEKALREHNISIPFPQRDIYIHAIQEEKPEKT